MTIGQWIKKYCEDNSIEMPTEIDNYTTQLDFLMLQNTGGGGSDFSIAKVTIAGIENPTRLYIPFIFDDIEESGLDSMGVINDGIYDVVMYKNCCYGIIGGTVNDVSVTGDISYYAGVFTITGNGTITIS